MTQALLTAVNSTSHVHLIVGSNPLAAARCNRSIEVGAKPKVIAPADATVHYGLQKRIDEGEVEWVKKTFEEFDLKTLGRDEVDNVVDAVFVTLGSRSPMGVHISDLCRRLRIPVNVADAPNLCTFTLLSTYTDGPLQIGITTSGKGCKLASRIRREVVSSLPPNLGQACEHLGKLRKRIWEEDHSSDLDAEAEEDSGGQTATFNKLILPEDVVAARGRRMRWLSQICEYWPLKRLTMITDADMNTILLSYASSTNPENGGIEALAIDARLQKARIILAGSGPGSPSLLTLATHRAIQSADVILADKLVPAPVLDLIPRRTTVHIARKFPGNAEAAQEELLSIGLDALKRGLCVLRLKQGDPYIYGRGGEEYAFFDSHGYAPTVLPGITSALSAPLFARVPPTQRAVADQILICTGTGRKGKAPEPPPFREAQTVVFLMALHRLEALVLSLTVPEKGEEGDDGGARKLWPVDTPCTVVERASCPDQRVIRATLATVCAAVEEEGARPPGLLVLGRACEALVPLKGKPWVVEEGCPITGFEDFPQAVSTEVGI
ncbi:MAG: hypothetical protein M1824_004183 [Vezdaea acicularis]|nr:MAG: hypothetical protein M1824_004183 [Vezdaea acicularis]